MENISYFFGGWLPILRIIVVGTLGYCALIIMIRMMRSRTLARLSAFDFVVTIAIGASFGRVLTARSIPLAEAVAAFMLLVLLQFLVSWLQMRSRRFSRWISTPPTLLFYRGSVVAQAMRRERITEDDLLSAVREHGVGSLSEVEAIVFEPNGRLGVVKKIVRRRRFSDTRHSSPMNLPQCAAAESSEYDGARASIAAKGPE